MGEGSPWGERDGSELGSAEPALWCSPSQEERDGVEAASLKTKAKLNKFPDQTS